MRLRKDIEGQIKKNLSKSGYKRRRFPGSPGNAGQDRRVRGVGKGVQGGADSMRLQPHVRPAPSDGGT